MVLHPGCGWLPPHWMPGTSSAVAFVPWPAAIPRPILPTTTPPGPPHGAQLARRLVKRGILVAPSSILLTDLGSQAIDLLCRFLLKPGDTVLVDDPCYFNFLAMLQVHHAQVIVIPLRRTAPTSLR